ncbi:MAG TPA: serine/threonine-protein kinase [Kofleriaceae bacterium]|nr:serine/threonine-protein kinase [Kofleriaceae bacterium]
MSEASDGSRPVTAMSISQASEAPGTPAGAMEATRTSPAATGPAPPATEASPPSRTFGRFVMLGTLGSGGMGVVISAYDPTLDRKVAIKLLRGDKVVEAATRGRAQLVAEAQAMARLSHPNVVPVHEIAFEEGSAFLVMEYVSGPTLRGWLTAAERPWTEVLAMFLAAGDGLAAAHREGIVHRDFKPENVLIDRDGRARVGDFGLAAVVASEPRPAWPRGVAGTLGYMAPEQLRGEPCDERADQFSFCVALWEALHGARPFAGGTASELHAAIAAGRVRDPARKTPDWVRGALLRGMKAEPAERWPSLEALLAALRRDPRAIRRRIGLGVALAAVVGAAAWLAWPSAEAIDPCGGAAARLAGVWDVARKVQVRAAFAATRLAYADDTWRAVRDRLDRYAAAWVAMSGEACRATRVEGRQSDTLMDLRMGCLEQRRGVLGALSALWSRGVDGDALAHAIDAASRLAPVAECAEARALSERAPVPANPVQANLIAPARRQLEALQALVLAHRLSDARTATAAARVAADATGWAPLRAEQAFAEGELLSVLGEASAEARLVEASQLADAAGDDRLRARALIALVDDLADHQQKADAALRMADLAEGAVVRAGDDEPLRGRLLRARGKALVTAGKYDAARAMLTDAHARLLHALGPADAETVATVDALARTANVQADYATAQRLNEQSLAVAIPVLGPDHPQVALLLTNLATVLIDAGKPAAAEEPYRRALAIDEKVFGPEAAPTAATLQALGRVEFELHHLEESRRFNERALAIREKTLGPDHPLVATALGNLALGLAEERKFDAAIPRLERALAIKIKAYGPAHSKVAASHEQLGQTYERMGDAARALESYRRALDIRRQTLGPDHALTLRVQGFAGQMLAKLHRCREARPLLARTIEGLTRADLNPPGVADALVADVLCDLDEGQPAAALARLDRVAQIAAKLDADPATLGGVEWLKARAHAALGHMQIAIAAARKAEQALAGDPESTEELAAARAFLAAHRR